MVPESENRKNIRYLATILVTGKEKVRMAISENAEPGSEASRVEVDDPDGKNSGLTYFIHAGSKDNFKIDWDHQGGS